MEVDSETNKTPDPPSLRPTFCSLGEITRSDGSVLLCQGDTAVACAVYGPVEVKPHKELITEALVEVVMKPRLGLPSVSDRDREEMIQRTCHSVLLTSLHPRTSIVVNIQELQDDGCLAATCINSACLALLDASVPMKSMVAAVSVVVDKEGGVVVDPTSKQTRQASASLLFVFESRDRGVVSTLTEGRVSQAKLQECLGAARQAVESVFQFYRRTVTKKFSKEIA